MTDLQEILLGVAVGLAVAALAKALSVGKRVARIEAQLIAHDEQLK